MGATLAGVDWNVTLPALGVLAGVLAVLPQWLAPLTTSTMGLIPLGPHTPILSSRRDNLSSWHQWRY